ncbi:competence type IV pilus assembly protein ComGB [Enterococcus sp. 2201sp1_2201st1_B8_2201SCRN_220225]|uniref:competence type IV pilus assembly protein ComGB n=1 Tax=unclassified Enterococcus TaxID=2608891 RepID=UPI0034A39BB3
MGIGKQTWSHYFSKEKSAKNAFFGKASGKKQLHLETLASLLANGFRLSEALEVMIRSGHFANESLLAFREALSRGETLVTCFTYLELSPQEISAIQLAQHHGDLSGTLGNIAEQIKLVNKQKQELMKTLAYPFLLILFVLSLLFGLRQFLLPQLLASGMMPTGHWGVIFLQQSPVILGSAVLFLLSLIGLCLLKLQGQDSLSRSCFWSRLPVIGGLYRLFITSYFSLEWGKLFKEGLELQQIITSMQTTDSRSLMFAMSVELHQGLSEGKPLSEQLSYYPFLTPEFAQIVFQGESKGRLGAELVLYSQLSRERFFIRVEKLVHLIQPVVFLLVAFLIVSLYAAMFLPLYDSMGELM